MDMVSKYSALNIYVKLFSFKNVVSTLSVNNVGLLDGAFHLTLEKTDLWIGDL